MSASLEDLIRKAAKSGRLNHLSIAFINGSWEASYRGVEDKDKRIVAHKDPVCALMESLNGRKVDAPKEVVPPKEKPVAKAPKPATPSVHDPLDDL